MFTSVISPLIRWSTLIAILLFPCIASLDAADGPTLVSNTNTHLHAEAGGNTVGQVLISTKLELVQKKGEWSEVTIQGWYQAGAKRALYALPGKRILDLVLSKKVVEQLQDLEQITDPDTELVWTRASFHGWIKNTAITDNEQLVWEQADALFSERCTACHQRRIPHHYTANQWIGNVKAMGDNAGLSKQERSLVLKFLQYRAKDMIQTSTN